MNDNLWDFIGLADKETLLTGVLGWLLNPKADHELGDLFLNKLLENAGLNTFSNPVIEVEKRINRRRRLDISLSNDGEPMVAFEVKCKTYGSVEQLYNYNETAPFVVRIGFGEWNYPNLNEIDRKRFPLLRFNEIAEILVETASSVGKYSDLINSVVVHLNKESKYFDDLYKYYIEESTDEPPTENSSTSQRFINLLYWRWFTERFDKDFPHIEWDWTKKSMYSGVLCITRSVIISEKSELHLGSIDLKLSGPLEAWVHLEVNNKASLVGNNDGIVGKIQFRVTGREDLNTIHEEFKKHEQQLTQMGYYVAKKKPGSSNYYNAITRMLTRKEMRYSSIIRIINCDFNEMI